ncbi:A1 cistron-splicing factor AAR2 protein [Dioscorea alata]|uniref:A1 cistron-splicing factor AAR2 protein n=1 Tax=Dioscorea alata TaxID=55571 RepID=A0ACB7URK0_DIOAL|nr:A1 cistron-splicing factor AAR2 protein [Dioscorea alata]
MQIGIDFQGQEKILSLRELWVLVDTFGSTIILMQQKLMIIRKNGKYSGTQLLETILLNDFKGAENLYLAELQFAFVAFMIGQSLQAFLQWKTLVSLFLCCTEAFIEVIYWQLKHGYQKQKSTTTAEGKGISVFLDDAWFLKDIFLYLLCKRYRRKIIEKW